MVGRHQSCIIDGYLYSSDPKMANPSATTSEPPCVGAAANDVKVPYHVVGGHPGARFSADLLHCTLHRETTSAKNSCPATSCLVVPKNVESTATRARMDREGQRQTKTSQEEDPERLRIHPCHPRHWE